MLLTIRGGYTAARYIVYLMDHAMLKKKIQKNAFFAWKNKKMCNLTPKKIDNKYIYLKNLISEVSHLIIIERTR